MNRIEHSRPIPLGQAPGRIHFADLGSRAPGFTALNHGEHVATLMHAPQLDGKLSALEREDAAKNAKATHLGYLVLDAPGHQHLSIQVALFGELLHRLPKLERVSTALAQLSAQEVLEQRFAGVPLKEAALTTSFVRAWAQLGFELDKVQPVVSEDGSLKTSEVKVTLKKTQTGPVTLPAVMPLPPSEERRAAARRVPLSAKDLQLFTAALLEGQPKEQALRQTRAYADQPVGTKVILMSFDEGFEPTVEVAARLS